MRPLSVLVKSLEHVKKRYKETEDFAWSNEQMKSIRQDITVQGIRNQFVLQVYETHSRILLEHGDLNEFNQCQTMIRSLTEGILEDDPSLLLQDDNGSGSGSPSKSPRKKKKRNRCKPLQQIPQAADEFGAYAILYALVQRSWMSLKMEMMRILPQLATNAPACRHAMAVVKSVEENNYRSFFTLYDQAPHMSVYLMDFLLKRIRTMAYDSIVTAFRPTIEVRQFQEWLGFLDGDEATGFLRERGAVFVDDDNSKEPDILLLDCKACCQSTNA